MLDDATHRVPGTHTCDEFNQRTQYNSLVLGHKSFIAMLKSTTFPSPDSLYILYYFILINYYNAPVTMSLSYLRRRRFLFSRHRRRRFHFGRAIQYYTLGESARNCVLLKHKIIKLFNCFRVSFNWPRPRYRRILV